MKNKPLRHKEQNTFKFIPFSERIANVKIDVVHQVKHKYEIENEETTFFYQTYEKWILLNCAQSFEDLRQDITPDVMTLPQLLARKDELIDVLKHHLSLKNPLNLQPLLEFIVALAKDIRQEFYPYFSSFYPLLVSLLDVKDAEILEWIFQCLAYLFKFLWRYLLNNLNSVFDSLLPLLDKSKPNYINNFAAQSFAFVARKLKDDSKLIKLIVKPLKEKPHAVEGCGRLLFEIIRGIPGHFHSSGERIFSSFLLSLHDTSFSYSSLCELLSQSLTHLLSHLNLSQVGLLWKILQESLTDFHSKCKIDQSERNIGNVEQILCMIQQSVEFKSCYLLVEPNALITLLLKLIEPENQICGQISDRVSQILAFILLSSKILPQELSSRIVVGAMMYLNEQDLLTFVIRIKTFSGFDGLVLPKLVSFCIEKSSPSSALPFLAKLVIYRAPPASDTRQLILWAPYSLNFSSQKTDDPSTYSNFYLGLFTQRSCLDHLKNFDDCIRVLLVLPHILPLHKEEAILSLKTLIDSICSTISKNENKVDLDKLLFILSMALETLIYLKPDDCITKIILPEVLLPVLLEYCSHKYLYVLRALDFYINVDELNEINKHASEIKKYLVPLLLSPYQKVRLHVTHILYEIEKSLGENEIASSILETCWLAECVPATISDYREKLKILQKLDCSNEMLRNAFNNNIADGRIPLTYLLGVIFVNFKLLWEPVSKIIMSYGSTLTPSAFWEVFGKQLIDVASIIREHQCESQNFISLSCSDLHEQFVKLNSLCEKPDYVNYRITLWNILKDLPEVYEFKSKDIVLHFLSFLEKEYNKVYSEAASSWDIRLLNKLNDSLDLSGTIYDENEESLMEEEQENHDNQRVVKTEVAVNNGVKLNETETVEIPKDQSHLDLDVKLESTNRDSQSNLDLNVETVTTKEIKNKLREDDLPESDWKSKWITKTLLAHMGVFGNFRSPKSLFRESDLNKIFHDFLSSRVSDIQKSAMDFILSYKHKYLSPYRDHLYRLIDDKTFRNELAIFRIDAQSDLIKDEHRPFLIPIVLRIVYSKMYSKVSSSKRETRHARKAAILRFLNGCSGEELSNFFNMAFNHITYLVSELCEPMVENVLASISLEKCIPPRRLLTTINLVDTIITQCGGLMQSKQISLIYRIILIVATFPAAIINKRHEVHPGYVKVLKNVKLKCFDAISHFFETFENYVYSEDEINGMFKVMIWPYLVNMQAECVNSPTAQLKLFILWSRNYRFFYLLDKKNAEGYSCLSTMISLWSVQKLHFSVHNALIDVVYNLINSGEEGDPGVDILKTYMPNVMEILQNRLSKKRSLSRKELSILSAVTSSSENISSESLLSVVLPSLLKPSKANDEEITDLLNTVGNLVLKVEDSTKFLYQLVPLFSSLCTPGHRKLLLSRIFEISKHCGHVLDEKILSDLNAWDPKWVEQPDFNKRLQAFSSIEQINERMSPIFAAIVIRTAYLYLRDEKDLSLKDSSRHCLKVLCPKVCMLYSEEKTDLEFLLDKTILPLIKSGLDDNSEVVRQECVSLLGYMVRESSSVHYVFKDLLPFSNKTDLEVDFFENLIHLQLHRRVRAMLRFAEVSENLELAIHPRTLVIFVLPMITQFLHSPKYADKNTIVDSAIKALGSICHSLPWRYYYAILRTYLGKLQSGTEYQKQTIRIISEIMNAFHFDLSHADEFRNNIPSRLDNKSEENVEDDILKEEFEFEENRKNNSDEETKKDLHLKEISLDKASANRVVHELAGVILPNLQKLLGEKSHSDSFHKVNKKQAYNEKDEEDILRIPLSIAIIKLLQKLPSSTLLERNLPGIFLKLSNYLKSRGESVRKTARSALETIMTSLGPSYLPILISELCALLTKGFHVHVLTYTVHGVLSKLKPFYSKGDIDPCIHKILSVCISDLFGTVSEEKEVNHITAKTIEAKANKSFDIFHILGTYSSENYLLDLVFPLKEELANTVSHKTIKKASDCLQQLALGLTENEFLSPESLLEFAYGLSTESIPALTAYEREKRDSKLQEYESRKGPDPYLIPEEPKQKKALMSVECMKTNAHILVEFGLKLLFFLLKREKINKQQFKPMLDPLIKLLLDCLKSKHVTVSTITLKCFSWVLRMELSSIESNIKEISTTFLEILHRYAAAGLSKGDNFDLVMAAFKAVSVLVRSCKSWKPDNDERRVLLLYCEQDIDDRERQATAFSLLKALIQKGITSEELNSVMKKVANVSIISPLDSVRVQARQVMLTYLMEYKIGKEFLTFVSFYLSQLSYKTKIGRESALEMIRTLISAIPKETLNEECGVIFVNIATRLVNEEDPDCKKEVAAVIVLLIQKLEQNAKDKLFDVTTAWINGKKILHRGLGMQLAGLFATAEKDSFNRRLELFLSLVANELQTGFSKNKPGRFVLLKKENIPDESNGDIPGDHLAFHTLHSLIKVFSQLPSALNDNKYAEHVETISDECQALLAHEHEWVRTQAVQLLGMILTERQNQGTKSLALDLLSQLTPSATEQLLMQSMKLLVHIAGMATTSPTEYGLNLPWLVRKVGFAVNREIVYSPKSHKIRIMACKWGAALSVKLNQETLLTVAFELLKPIVKGMASEDAELAKASKAAGGYIKGKLGQAEYNNLLSRISQNIEAKKAIRRKERTQLAVTDPERAAKRKINRQIKKKTLKKRKVELMKNHKFKKKKKNEIEIEM